MAEVVAVAPAFQLGSGSDRAMTTELISNDCPASPSALQQKHTTTTGGDTQLGTNTQTHSLSSSRSDSQILFTGARSAVSHSHSQVLAEAKLSIMKNLPIQMWDGMQTYSEPWIDPHNGQLLWSSWRIRCAMALRSKWMELALTCTILFNVFVIMFEVNMEGQCYPKYQGRLCDCPTASDKYLWVAISNRVLLGAYTIEALVSIFVFRSLYFKNKVTLFDFSICVIGWMGEVLDSFVNLTFFRILRIGRVFKAMHIVTTIPELCLMMACFVGSMKAMFFGAIVLLILVTFFSIIMVQVIHPINSEINYGPDCPRCPHGYQSIPDSMITLFQQVVAGDSWGTMNMEIIDSNWWGLLLPLTQLVIGVGAMNLILAVVVDRAMQYRESSQVIKARAKAEEETSRKLELLDVLSQLDTEKSGHIDRQKVAEAARKEQEFVKHLLSAGISLEELDQVSEYVEGRSKKHIDFLELCQAITEIESSDERKTVVLMRMNAMCMDREIADRFRAQDTILQRQNEALDALGKQISGLQTAVTAAVQRKSQGDHSALAASMNSDTDGHANQCQERSDSRFSM